MAGKWRFKVNAQHAYLDTVNGDPWTLWCCDIADVCTQFSSGVGGSDGSFVDDYWVSF